MAATTRTTRRLALCGLAVAVSLSVAGCEGDGQSGIPTDPPPTTSAAADTTDPEGSAAADTTGAVRVGDVPGNAAATAALQSWVDDLVAGNDVAARCWTIAPERAAQMYDDVDAITAAVTRPGSDGQYTATWSSPDGVAVSVLRSEIASGYACPYIHHDGEDIYTGADAIHAVTRFLGRVTGDPVSPQDAEENYPLVCEARAIWDPWGSGYPDVPPMSADPSVLDAVTTFDAESATFTPLDDVYGSVTIPVIEAETSRNLDVYVTTGSNGYCLGAVD